MNFSSAIRRGFQHFFDFRSRSTRAEYWWFGLFLLLSVVILTAFDVMAGTYNAQTGSGLFSGLFRLFMLIPCLAVGARRLHDINKSGWWLLLGVLIIPQLLLWWWATKPSDEGTNEHGPDPRQETSE